MAHNPKQFAAAAKSASDNLATLRAEVDAVLNKIAGDENYATQFFNAVDADDRKEVISLLKKGGIKQTRIDGLHLFPGNLKVKVEIDFKNMRFIVEIDTSS